MKHIRQFITALSQPATFFPSTFTEKSLMTIRGNEQIIVENVYTLQYFSPVKIIIICGNNTIEIIGKDFILKAMLKEELLIEGILYEFIFLE